MDLVLGLALALSHLWCGADALRCTVMDDTRTAPSLRRYAGEMRRVPGGFIAVSADSQQVIWCQCQRMTP